MEGSADKAVLCDEELGSEELGSDSDYAFDALEEPIPQAGETQDEEDIIKSLIEDEQLIEFIDEVDSQARAQIIDTILGSLKAQQYPHAVHLAVQIFDRYLALGNLPQQLDQMTVASFSLYIAAQFEYGINLAERMAFPHRDAETEFDILGRLDYRLHNPTTKTIIETFLHVSGESEQIKLLCCYISDLSLLELHFSKLYPTRVAAACIFLAKFILNPETRPEPIFSVECDRDDRNMRQHVRILFELYKGQRLPALRSTRDKYRSSQMECPEVIPDEYFD